MPVSKKKDECWGDVMGEFKRGQLHSGKDKKQKVKSPDQAKAIAASMCNNGEEAKAKKKEQAMAIGYSEEAAELIAELHFEEEKKLKKKYASGLTSEEQKTAKREAKETMEKKGSAKEVYEDWDSDKSYRDRQKKKGKSMPKSAATKAYEDKFESSESEDFSDKGLAAKAKKSGISLSTLKAVYQRGMAAWKSGHRPGVSPQQWAMARVNSFITGKGGARKADSDLWKKKKK